MQPETKEKCAIVCDCCIQVPSNLLVGYQETIIIVARCDQPFESPVYRTPIVPLPTYRQKPKENSFSSLSFLALVRSAPPRTEKAVAEIEYLLQQSASATRLCSTPEHYSGTFPPGSEFRNGFLLLALVPAFDSALGFPQTVQAKLHLSDISLSGSIHQCDSRGEALNASAVQTPPSTRLKITMPRQSERLSLIA